jgi:ABC-type thiamine transport system substrate-binding protein
MLVILSKWETCFYCVLLVVESITVEQNTPSLVVYKHETGLATLSSILYTFQHPHTRVTIAYIPLLDSWSLEVNRKIQSSYSSSPRVYVNMSW